MDYAPFRIAIIYAQMMSMYMAYVFNNHLPLLGLGLQSTCSVKLSRQGHGWLREFRYVVGYSPNMDNGQLPEQAQARPDSSFFCDYTSDQCPIKGL